MLRMKKIWMICLLACLVMGSVAQTENPRGIYKMITLTGKVGEVKAPFDQYKICTDSVTLLLSMQGSVFSISDNDHQIFNYTGDQPKDENDKSSLIYDSNANHFTLKWWSETPNHLHFPNKGWCIEKYEANQYSETGRRAFNALTAVPAFDKSNPLLGTWRVLGDVDELRDVKTALPKLLENYESSRYSNTFFVFTPTTFALVLVNRGGGVANPVEYEGKNAYRLNDKASLKVKWLTKDRIAVEERIDYRTDWKILERVTDGHTMLSRIASRNISRR